MNANAALKMQSTNF